MNEYLNNIYNEIGTSREYLTDIIVDLELNGAISSEYSRLIAEKIVDDVAEEIHLTADHEDWNSSDVKLSVGRILCNKLGIEY